MHSIISKRMVKPPKLHIHTRLLIKNAKLKEEVPKLLASPMLLQEIAMLYKMLWLLHQLLLELMLKNGNSTLEESLIIAELNWITESWQLDIPIQPKLEVSGKLKTHGEQAGEKMVSSDSPKEILAVFATLHLTPRPKNEKNLYKKLKLLLRE